MFRLQGNRLSVAGLRFGIFSQPLQYVTQIVVGIGIFWIDSNDAPNQLSRLGVSVLLVAKNTHIMQSVQVIGCRCDDISVKIFCCLQ